MHTALCSFDDRAQADSAMHRLVLAGFDTRDVHLQHRDAAETGIPGHHSGTARWDTMEREVAVDPSRLAKLGRFFTSLFGANDTYDHASSYAEVVERGSFVVVVDADDEAGAQRAQALMHELQAGAVNVVHRPTQRPLRDIVGSRQGVMPLEGSAVTERAVLGEDTLQSASYEAERALASDRLDQSRTVDPRDEPTMGPGLRYMDKDKPNG
ncbi:MAG: hypothetical protein JWQ76_2253 [Ramlibacter sp.]|nr:hypothetical protein [Ramlibacter sp.]